MTFFITRPALQEIERRAIAGFPHEICGFLGGEVVGQGRETRPARNVATDPRVEYNIAPEETLAALLDLERRGLKLTGVYHSHPRYPARPSGTDLALADLPGAVYLITSVMQEPGGSLRCETRAWQLQRRRAIPTELVVIGQEP